jgi:hypothetical protein
MCLHGFVVRADGSVYKAGVFSQPLACVFISYIS